MITDEAFDLQLNPYGAQLSRFTLVSQSLGTHVPQTLLC